MATTTRAPEPPRPPGRPRAVPSSPARLPPSPASRVAGPRLHGGRRRRRELATLRAVAVLAATTCTAGILAIVLWNPANSDHLSGTAAHDVAVFFHRYVNVDGQVVRRDQGGDTVSEGEAYALLLAVAAGDRPQFDRVWGWTTRHLQESDGLLAWRWANGRVADPNPASDADLLCAWALAAAAIRFAGPPYAAAARRVSAGILADETVATPDGPVLVAGPWARSNRVVDPSYLTPAAFAALGRLTGDTRWAQLAATSAAGLHQLTTAPARLPPDWATVSPGGTFTPRTSPGDQPPAYGLDAARVEVWYATACTPSQVALAAGAWPLLLPSVTSFSLSRSLSGHPQSEAVNPIMAVASAATARAAGRSSSAEHLLADADRLAARYPGYYGEAWVALGRVLLTSTALPGCSIA